MEALEYHKGEPFIIEGKGEIGEEQMRDDELGPSNRNRPRESNYEADNDDSNTRRIQT